MFGYFRMGSASGSFKLGTINDPQSLIKQRELLYVAYNFEKPDLTHVSIESNGDINMSMESGPWSASSYFVVQAWSV